MSIFFNNSRINDWYYNSSDIIKVYHNGAVCYYKLDSSSPSGQTPCFAVVDDITQYTETEFEDVFDKATEKWYKLNNLNQYEEYGVYGSGRTICEGPTSRLPQGYTEVEYITSENISESVLGAYIDTNYKPTQNTRVVIDFQSTSNTREFQRIFGSGEFDMLGYLVNIEGKIGNNNGKYYYKFDQNSGWYITNVKGDLNRHVIDYNNSRQFLLDNVSIATLPNNTFTCTSNLGIFWSINTKYTTNNINFIGRVYSCQVYDNGTLVRDFVPCTNPSNAVGMYDIVNDVFYTTANQSYQFEAGSAVTPTDCVTTYEGKLTIDDGYEYIYSGNSWVNVGEVSGSSRLPVGYTEVEYITAENLASGITGPYIDTNFTPNQNTRVVLDYQAIVNGQNNRRIFGSGRFNNTSSGNYIWSMENRIGQSNCYYYYKFDNGSSWKTSTLHPDLNRHVVDFNKEGKIWLDDTAVITLPSTSFTCSYHLGIFNEINSGAQTLYEYFQGRVYSCQVYDNGTMVRDLVPCTNSSNVAGMYDLVNDVFYTTANQSYQFEAGSSVAPPIVLPINYDEKADPPNNLTFSSMTEAEEYECPWVGMNATIDGSRYIFSGDSTSGYEWVEIISPIPSEYTELEYCVVPRVKPTTLFTVPYECQPNYKYTTEFTPLNFWSTSYYGGIAGYNDSNNKDFEYFIFKLDNGWGDQFNRFVIKFQNYEWDTRNSGTVPRAFTFYENVRAKITLHLNNYSAGQGAVLTIENEGYTTYSNTRTQVIDSSWQITYGVKDLNLLNDNSTNDFCANMNFHNFKVEDTQGNLIYDYRPVTRLSDNKVGLYDVVKQQFFYPTGFTLTAGPSV